MLACLFPNGSEQNSITVSAIGQESRVSFSLLYKKLRSVLHVYKLQFISVDSGHFTQPEITQFM